MSMKKEVPPFGVLAADYDPEYNVIVSTRSVTETAKRTMRKTPENKDVKEESRSGSETRAGK